jgi:hypothetical protein
MKVCSSLLLKEKPAQIASYDPNQGGYASWLQKEKQRKKQLAEKQHAEKLQEKLLVEKLRKKLQ